MTTSLRLLALLSILTMVAMGCSSTDEETKGDAAAETDTIGMPDFTQVDWVTDQDTQLADTLTDGAIGDGVTEVGQETTGDMVEEAAGDVTGDAGPFEYPCEPGTEQTCETVCGTTGTQMCMKEWGPCIPPFESCSNCIDDDCDGVINEDCPPNPDCDPPPVFECPVAIITVTEGTDAWTGDTLHLSATASYGFDGASIVTWKWSVNPPAGAAGAFAPSDTAEEVTFPIDVAGQYQFILEVWDDNGMEGCAPSQVLVTAQTYPPVEPSVGCSDGEREGFVDQDAYPQIAGCSGAWSEPGVTPDTVVPTCNRGGGDDGSLSDGTGCSSVDLCAEGWHICDGWWEVAAKSTTGCVGAVPTGAPDKSLFFAIRQPSENGTVCGEWGDGFNDVFGCGNLGHTLSADKGCGPLDRALASTQPGTCGYNEAEPNLGPWQCLGDNESHLNEGALVTKDGCNDTSCSYDGQPLSSSDKGGVLCCHD